MSRKRHEMAKRAKGGGVFYEGAGSNAAKEAEDHAEGGDEGVSKKRGGKVMHGEGGHSKKRADKRARGGGVHGEEPHHAVKEKSMAHKHGMRVPGRARGGGVGADRTPLSSAANIKQLKGETPERGEPSD